MSDSLLITLGSSSVSRKAQLNHYKLPFTSISPNADETLLRGESCEKAVQRICRLKQDSLIKHDHEVLITADQMLEVSKTPLGKPLHYDKAVEQLMFCSGKSGIFHSAMIIWSSKLKKSFYFHIKTFVKYAPFDERDVHHYLKKDKPEHCAGSIKIESLGLILMDSVQSEDPSAIIGLPMLSLFKTLSIVNTHWRLMTS